jgi:hypothetical protein
MEAFSFFFKSLLIAFVAVLLMQIELGGDTVESHILTFVRTSTVTEPVQNVATGATKAVRNGWNYVTKFVNNNKPAVGERASAVFNNFERSDAYKKVEATKSEASEVIEE